MADQRKNAGGHFSPLKGGEGGDMVETYKHKFLPGLSDGLMGM